MQSNQNDPNKKSDTLSDLANLNKPKRVLKVKLKPKPTVRATLAKPKPLFVSDYLIAGEQKSRVGEMATLDRIFDDIKRLGYNQNRLDALSVIAKAYAKGSSAIPAKELLELFADIINTPDFGGTLNKPSPTSQDRQSVDAIRDLIFYIYKAIRVYEDILRRQREQNKNE